MRAAGAWARVLLRRHRGASVLLVVLVALSTSVVAASVAAARRANGSLGRFTEYSDPFDATVFSCPPGVDPNEFESQVDINSTCLNRAHSERSVAELRSLPHVTAAASASYAIVAILDSDAPNGWGRVTLMTTTGPGAGIMQGRPLVEEGRLPDDGATDEVVLTEDLARSSGIEVGDTVRLASWGAEELDAAVNEGLRPHTDPIRMRVVGIGRFKSDLAPPNSGDLSGIQANGELATSGRSSLSVAGFATYGIAPVLQLRDGTGGVDQLTEDLLDLWPDRFFTVEPADTTFGDDRTTELAIDTERRAVLGFALIAGIATAGFVGLILVRQLRREQRDAPTLRALGMSRGEVVLGSVARAVIIAVPASLLAVVLTIATSPLTPIGVARRGEPDLGFFVDAPVVAAVALAVMVGVLAIASAVPLIGQTERSTRPPLRAAAAVTGNLGPAARVGLTLARGSWPRTAAVVTGAALAALVASSMLVTSLDRVVDAPHRYGAWWDLTMGDYADPSSIALGAEIVAQDPDVEAIAGLYDQTDVAVADGHPIDLIAYVPYQGAPEPVLARGRAPVDTDEIALAHDTLRELDKDIGDLVELTGVEGASDAPPLTLTITGEFLNNNPVTLSTSAGDGGFVLPEVVDRLSPGVATQLLVSLREGADREVVVRRLATTYFAGIRATSPQDDIRNLSRLRGLPWLIAGLITSLALATLVHALVTMVLRHRRDLAILRVMGLSRRATLSVTAWSTAYLMIGATGIGLVLGYAGGRALWDTLADGVAVPSSAVRPLLVPVLVVAATMVVSQAVAWIATSQRLRMSTADLLRAE